MPSIAISTNGNGAKVSDLEKKIESLSKLAEFYREESERSEEDVTKGVANYFITKMDELEKKITKLEKKK